MELLLGKDANVNLVNNYRRTALMIAARKEHKDIVELLLGKDANVNLANNNGATALMIAAESGHKDIVELLLGKGADVNKPTTDGWTALMIAAQNGHKDIVELLVNKVDDVNLANNNGVTALMIAAESGNKDIVELLAKKLIKDNELIIIQELSDEVCPISQEKYNALYVPVEFYKKVYELSSLVAWIYEKNKDSLPQGRKIEFAVPHSNDVVSYSSLNELCKAIKPVQFKTPVSV